VTEIPGFPLAREGRINWPGALTGSGNVGIGTTSPAAALHVVGDIQYTGLLKDLSDRRAKHDIRAPARPAWKIGEASAGFLRHEQRPESRTELGLIAQDVEPLYPDLVATDASGMKSMAHVSLVTPMIEGMQEQQAEINQLRAGLAVMFFGSLFLLWRNRAKLKV
jgi:hypothetical protein